jgi:hypothetical protein
MMEVGVGNESRRKQFAGKQIGGKTLDENMRSATQKTRVREKSETMITKQRMMI